MLLRLSILTLFILVTTFVTAQTYEAGLVLGGTNFVGDVGSSSFVKHGDYIEKVSYGVIFKWNRSTRHAFRASVIQHRTFGDDKLSESIGRKERGYQFKNSITEFSAGLEFNFWEWNLHDIKRPQIVPYISTGLSFFMADDYRLDINVKEDYNKEDFSADLVVKKKLNKIDDKNYSFAIPLIFGVKGAVSEDFVIALEFGARYAFTDNLDGSKKKKVEADYSLIDTSKNKVIKDALTFGNESMNDWYIFGGITLTYTFGRKPCYYKF